MKGIMNFIAHDFLLKYNTKYELENHEIVTFLNSIQRYINGAYVFFSNVLCTLVNRLQNPPHSQIDS